MWLHLNTRVYEVILCAYLVVIQVSFRSSTATQTRNVSVTVRLSRALFPRLHELLTLSRFESRELGIEAAFTVHFEDVDLFLYVFYYQPSNKCLTTACKSQYLVTHPHILSESTSSVALRLIFDLCPSRNTSSSQTSTYPWPQVMTTLFETTSYCGICTVSVSVGTGFKVLILVFGECGEVSHLAPPGNG